MPQTPSEVAQTRLGRLPGVESTSWRASTVKASTVAYSTANGFARLRRHGQLDDAVDKSCSAKQLQSR